MIQLWKFFPQCRLLTKVTINCSPFSTSFSGTLNYIFLTLNIGILDNFLFSVHSFFTAQAVWEHVPISALEGTVKSLHILKSWRKSELQKDQHMTLLYQ